MCSGEWVAPRSQVGLPTNGGDAIEPASRLRAFFNECPSNASPFFVFAATTAAG
jgi:hypothetical protein